MHAVACDGVKIRGQGGRKGFAFAGFHFGDAALMEHDAADQLHPEGTHAQRAPAGLPHHGKGFGEHMIQGFAALIALLKFRRFGAERFIAEHLHLRLQPVDLIGNLHQGLQLRFIAKTQHFFQKFQHLLSPCFRIAVCRKHGFPQTDWA